MYSYISKSSTVAFQGPQTGVLTNFEFQALSALTLYVFWATGWLTWQKSHVSGFHNCSHFL